MDTVNVQLISAGRLKGIYSLNARITFVVLAPDCTTPTNNAAQAGKITSPLESGSMY